MAPSAVHQQQIRVQVSEDAILARHTQDELPAQGGYSRIEALLSLGDVGKSNSCRLPFWHTDRNNPAPPDSAQPNSIMQIHLLPGQAEIDPLWQATPIPH